MRRSAALILTLAATAGLMAACSSSPSASSTSTTVNPCANVTPPPASVPPAPNGATIPTLTPPTGPPPTHLVSTDLIVGTGAAAQNGDSLTMEYVGYSYTCKKIFQASWYTAQPFTFTLGAGQVISGWDHGIVGMKVGGRRELILPPSLAYGPNSPGPGIAPNDTLVFVVDLLSVTPPGSAGSTTTTTTTSSASTTTSGG